MEKLAKMAMLDVSDAEKIKDDIEQILKMSDILKTLPEEYSLENYKEGDLRKDEVKETMLFDDYITVAKVVGDCDS